MNFFIESKIFFFGLVLTNFFIIFLKKVIIAYSKGEREREREREFITEKILLERPVILSEGRLERERERERERES